MLRRLQVAGCSALNITADREITKVGFKRKALSSFLGGNMQECFSEPAHSWFKMHGLDVILYPSRDWNPHTPIARGEPGLFFSSINEDSSKNDALPMFAKIERRHSESNLWYYFGHYVVRPSENLSVEEYRGLSPLVRRSRSRFISNPCNRTRPVRHGPKG